MSETENTTQSLESKDYRTNADLKAVLREVLESVIAERIEPRFIAIEARLDKIEQRLDQVDQRLDKVEQRLDKVEQRLDSLEKAFVKLERRFSHHQAETAERLTILEDRVIDLETPAA
jgi:septal ring factor EnvC (AmiA/AmiB activator)